MTFINESSITVDVDLVLPFDSFLHKCLSVKVESNEVRTVFPGKDVKEKKARIYTIRISKKSKAQISLEFQPE